MDKEELKARTKRFALEIIKLVDLLPETKAGRTISNQLIRSGTSVAANYRAVCRSRSDADFVSKMTVVEEECDETLFWLELICESAILPSEKLTGIMKEANELTAIFTASGKTAKNRKRRTIEKFINP